MLLEIRKNFVATILSWPRLVKRAVVVCMDAASCALAVWLAYFLRTGEFVLILDQAIPAVIVSVALIVPFFIYAGLYKTIFRHTGSVVIQTTIQVVGIYSLIYMAIFSAVGVYGVPRTVGIVQPILVLFLVLISRMTAHYAIGGGYVRAVEANLNILRVLIYGTGNAGIQLASSIMAGNEMRLVGYLDDDQKLHGQYLNGVPVFDPDEVSELVTDLEVDEILLAIPNALPSRRKSIVDKMAKMGLGVRTIPSMKDLLLGSASLSQLRELDVNDLLGRDTVPPIPKLLGKTIKNKVVFVTGAGGSIGGELCRTIIALEPKKLIVLDNNEFALYKIHQELQSLAQNVSMTPVLGNVLNRVRMDKLISIWQPDTLFHAAAFKHVPLVEHNMSEAVQNNVLGTFTLVEIAALRKVKNFVLISTDKAVRPKNMMGATKRIAEMILQAISVGRPTTKFSIVRFGNVLGSSGSVVPLFKDQIRRNEPVTVTHPEITRFFMTVSEAAQLVIQASAMAKRGDIFVLDMGQPVKILDLAKKMISLLGTTAKNKLPGEQNLEIRFTGLRPGEKLYEELLVSGNVEETLHPRIFRAKEDFLGWSELDKEIKAIELAVKEGNIENLLVLVQRLVPEYKPDNLPLEFTQI